MHVNEFINPEASKRPDGRYDTAFVLNLTGVPLEDNTKVEFGYSSKYGYGDDRKFGAVIEIVDKVPSFSDDPHSGARLITRVFHDRNRALNNQKYVVRTHLMILPSRGDPRLGFCLCSEFVNESGRVYVRLIDKKPKKPKKFAPMNKVKLEEFHNEKVGTRSDGRYETVYILNLTGTALAIAKKGDMGFEAVHGYSSQMTKFGAVFEFVDKPPKTAAPPKEVAAEIAKAFLEASQEIGFVGKRYSSRTYKLMLPRKGDPRFGYYLCQEFINQKGEVFISLL